jgi:hypothetical protein
MAGYFDSSVRTPGAKGDACFDNTSQDLLAAMFLAAAKAKYAISQVWIWITDQRSREPVSILDSVGYPLIARQMEAFIDAPDKQRAGIYGTTQMIGRVPTNSRAMRWVTPQNRKTRPQCDPEQFVRDGTGTMFNLSREGKDMAAASARHASSTRSPNSPANTTVSPAPSITGKAAATSPSSCGATIF